MILFISSDTNIWIDFFEIQHVDHPFLLDFDFYLSSVAYEDELIKSEELCEVLLTSGLHLANVTEDEFTMTQIFRSNYPKLSLYDTLALSIAKNRSWMLLTGDRPLRNAAEHEGVECHGVIWIYDELLHQKKIDTNTYQHAMSSLLTAVNEGRCRLPVRELLKRIERD